jgi:soluble lytic murein transglycosylase-like protein
MQLIDTTAESMGVKNVWDPLQNIQGGARYLKQQLQKFNGDISLALASYNAGPGNVEKYNGIPPFRETRNYVKRVMNLFSAFQSMERKSDDVIE